MKIVDFMDLTLLCKPVYLNICIGMSLVLVSLITFFTILPSYLRHLLFSREDTALIVSICAFADLSSRMFVTIISSWLRIRARNLFLAGVIGTIIGQLGRVFVYSHKITAFITLSSNFEN